MPAAGNQYFYDPTKDPAKTSGGNKACSGCHAPMEQHAKFAPVVESLSNQMKGSKPPFNNTFPCCTSSVTAVAVAVVGCCGCFLASLWRGVVAVVAVAVADSSAEVAGACCTSSVAVAVDAAGVSVCTEQEQALVAVAVALQGHCYCGCCCC